MTCAFRNNNWISARIHSAYHIISYKTFAVFAFTQSLIEGSNSLLFIENIRSIFSESWHKDMSEAVLFCTVFCIGTVTHFSTLHKNYRLVTIGTLGGCCQPVNIFCSDFFQNSPPKHDDIHLLSPFRNSPQLD